MSEQEHAIRAKVMKTFTTRFMDLLKDKLNSELQDTGIMRGSRGQKGRRTTVSSVARNVVDGNPLRVIEDVEPLCPELNVHRLVNRELLEESDVEVGAPREPKDVATRVAKR